MANSDQSVNHKTGEFSSGSGHKRKDLWKKVKSTYITQKTSEFLLDMKNGQIRHQLSVTSISMPGVGKQNSETRSTNVNPSPFQTFKSSMHPSINREVSELNRKSAFPLVNDTGTTIPAHKGTVKGSMVGGTSVKPQMSTEFPRRVQESVNMKGGQGGPIPAPVSQQLDKNGKSGNHEDNDGKTNSVNKTKANGISQSGDKEHTANTTTPVGGGQTNQLGDSESEQSYATEMPKSLPKVTKMSSAQSEVASAKEMMSHDKLRNIPVNLDRDATWDMSRGESKHVHN